MPFRITTLAGLAALLLTGCAASNDRYPSLAVRDAERVTGEFTPAYMDDPAPTYTTDRRRIGDALEQARTAHGQFTQAQPGVLGLARAASGRGNDSDARAQALSAMAELTTLRGQTVMALSDLDRLEAEAATLYADLSDIREAQVYVAGLVGEQDAALDSVARAMGL